MPHLEAVNTPHTRADVWNVSNAHCRVHYQMLAEAEPDLLCRALNLFALQCLTPRQVSVQRTDDLLSIAIVIDGLSWHRAQVIAEKLRNLISVCSVELQAADSAWNEPAQAAG
jgi:acetolactate synthase small subunit